MDPGPCGQPAVSVLMVYRTPRTYLGGVRPLRDREGERSF